MTTLAELVTETEQLSLGGLKQDVNRLAAALTISGTTATLSRSLGGVQAGSIISVDLEDMYVEEVDSTAKTATVIRAWNGTTAAAHDDNSVVYVNARASKGRILQAINNELRSIASPGLFRIRTVEITFSSSVAGYDMTSVTDMIGEPIKILRKQSGSSKYWPEVRSWRFDSNVDTAIFASGKSLSILEGAESGQPIRVFYRAPFVALTALANDVAAVSFLPEYAHNILPLGAAIRILRGRAVERADLASQGDSRRAEEVSTSDIARAIGVLDQQRARALAEAQARLTSEFPSRIRV